MSRSKDIGTTAETKVVRFLRDNGFPNAERRALHGTTDLGDITGTPGLVWEVKAGQAANTASDGQIAAWWAETCTETLNAGARYGFLVVARSRKNVRDWWAVCDAADLGNLACGIDTQHSSTVLARCTLGDLVKLLDASGWTAQG